MNTASKAMTSAITAIAIATASHMLNVSDETSEVVVLGENVTDAPAGAPFTVTATLPPFETE